MQTSRGHAHTPLKSDFSLALCEFLEAAIHTVLRSRSLYDSDLFEVKKIFNVAVRKSRHPPLNEYISSVVLGLQAAIEQHSLKKLAILFLDNLGRVVERVVLYVELGSAWGVEGLDLEQLESNLGSILVKLQFAGLALKPLPKGCTFEVAVYTNSRAHIPRQLFEEHSTGDCELTPPPAATPLKSIHVPGVINLQVVVEEDRDLKGPAVA